MEIKNVRDKLNSYKIKKLKILPIMLEIKDINQDHFLKEHNIKKTLFTAIISICTSLPSKQC